MDTAQWPQCVVLVWCNCNLFIHIHHYLSIEDIVVVTKPPTSSSNLASENNNNNNNSIKKPRPQKEQALNCPRCHSTNTKFCYYNNYSLSQPRYFCKTCRRYWTEGGSLRNIPVGGGSRKNKRSSSIISSSPSSPSISLPSPPKNFKLTNNNNPNSENISKVVHEGQDLNLGFPSSTTTTIRDHNNNNNNNNNNNLSSSSSTITSTVNTTTTTPSTQFSAMELLTGITSENSRGGLNSFLPHQHVQVHHPPDPNTIYNHNNTTFPLQDYLNKPAGLNFSLDGIGIGGSSGFAGLHHQQDQTGGVGNGRLLFPFEDLKQVSESNNKEHHQQGDSSGYWSGMLGGGSW